jgi:peptide chain release factor 2
LTRSASPPLCYGGVFDWDTATKRLDELTALSERPDFWNDPQDAQKLMRERQKLADGIALVAALERDIADAPELLELSEGDAAMQADIQASLARAAEKAQKAELAALLSGEADGNDCYVQINAGEGGTESQDWASILRRMYVRWAEKHGYAVDELDEREGEDQRASHRRIICPVPT